MQHKHAKSCLINHYSIPYRFNVKLLLVKFGYLSTTIQLKYIKVAIMIKMISHSSEGAT